MKIVIISFIVFLLGLIMSMVGRGGGNFYVPILIAAGVSMTTAAATAQLLLMTTSLLATLVFQHYQTVDRKLALIIDPPTDIMAFFGGYFAHCFRGVYLKILFAVLLIMAAFLMLKPIPTTQPDVKKRVGHWYRSFGQYTYQVNLWLIIPLTAEVGFFSGMIGISGGSFKIPLMVLVCGVPMRIAIGTSSAMVAVTAFTGFTGHALAGDVHTDWILPLVCAAAAGGILGGQISMRVNPHRLKKWFAFSTMAAALFMVGNALLTK